MMQAGLGNVYMSSVCANQLCQDVAQSRQDTGIQRRLHYRSCHGARSDELWLKWDKSAFRQFKTVGRVRKSGFWKDIVVLCDKLGTDSTDGRDTVTVTWSRYTVVSDACG